MPLKSDFDLVLSCDGRGGCNKQGYNTGPPQQCGGYDNQQGGGYSNQQGGGYNQQGGNCPPPQQQQGYNQGMTQQVARPSTLYRGCAAAPSIHSCRIIGSALQRAQRAVWVEGPQGRGWCTAPDRSCCPDVLHVHT